MRVGLKLNKFIIAISLLFTSLTCQAGFKSFEAAVDESTWRFVGNSINCQLSHNIPLYGNAEFQKQAGRDQALNFKLGYKRHNIGNNKTAAVRAIAPSWQPLQASRHLGEVKLEQGKHIISSQNMATWQLLNELEIGRFPTFFYQDFIELEDQVSVALSSVGFQFEYDKFLTCLSLLVPYQLNELRRMTFYFDFDKASVKVSDRGKLEALAAYIKFDSSVEVIIIRGYTDSKGSRYYNHKLSQRRIQSVINILSLDGVDQNRFKSQAFGEKKPVATNRNAKGRAKNRRIYINIAQR